MSLPAAGGSNRYATEHIWLDGVASGPVDVGDYRYKAWAFDCDTGETGDGYTLDEAVASEIADTPADACYPIGMNVQHGPATTDAIGATVTSDRTTTNLARKDHR
jgi:hypothetical protein